jgi:hypothetical protein
MRSRRRRTLKKRIANVIANFVFASYLNKLKRRHPECQIPLIKAPIPFHCFPPGIKGPSNSQSIQTEDLFSSISRRQKHHQKQRRKEGTSPSS